MIEKTPNDNLPETAPPKKRAWSVTKITKPEKEALPPTTLTPLQTLADGKATLLQDSFGVYVVRINDAAMLSQDDIFDFQATLQKAILHIQTSRKTKLLDFKLVVDLSAIPVQPNQDDTPGTLNLTIASHLSNLRGQFHAQYGDLEIADESKRLAASIKKASYLKNTIPVRASVNETALALSELERKNIVSFPQGSPHVQVLNCKAFINTLSPVNDPTGIIDQEDVRAMMTLIHRFTMQDKPKGQKHHYVVNLQAVGFCDSGLWSALSALTRSVRLRGDELYCLVNQRTMDVLAPPPFMDAKTPANGKLNGTHKTPAKLFAETYNKDLPILCTSMPEVRDKIDASRAPKK